LYCRPSFCGQKESKAAGQEHTNSNNPSGIEGSSDHCDIHGTPKSGEWRPQKLRQSLVKRLQCRLMPSSAASTAGSGETSSCSAQNHPNDNSHHMHNRNIRESDHNDCQSSSMEASQRHTNNSVVSSLLSQNNTIVDHESSRVDVEIVAATAAIHVSRCNC
jgi:hypothetical protein